MRAEAVHPPAEWMDGYLPTFFSGPVPPEADELLRTMMLAVRPAGLLPMLTAFADADLRDGQGGAGVPLTVELRSTSHTVW